MRFIQPICIFLQRKQVREIVSFNLGLHLLAIIFVQTVLSGK